MTTSLYGQAIEVEEALLVAVVELAESGKLQTIFPDGPGAAPLTQGTHKMPTVLLEISMCLRVARERHGLSLSKAIRVAFMAHHAASERVAEEWRKQLQVREAQSRRAKFAAERMINRIVSQT